MAEPVSTTAAAVTLVTAARGLILTLKNVIGSLTDDQKGECIKLQTEVEGMKTFFEMTKDKPLYHLPELQQPLNDVKKLLETINDELKKKTESRKVTRNWDLKRFLKKASDDLEHFYKRLKRCIELVNTNESVQRGQSIQQNFQINTPVEPIPQTGETGGPPESVSQDGETDGPQGLPPGLPDNSQTMTAAIAMDADQTVRKIRYKPKNYPRLKVFLFDALQSVTIQTIGTALEIPSAKIDTNRTGGGDTLFMVDVLEQRGVIKETSIDKLIKALEEVTQHQGLINKIRRLFNESEGFGQFRVKLSMELTDKTMYRLATVLEFAPADVDKMNLHPDGEIVFLLEQMGIIQEEDVSKLITVLGKIPRLDGLCNAVKGMTEEYEPEEDIREDSLI